VGKIGREAGWKKAPPGAERADKRFCQKRNGFSSQTAETSDISLENACISGNPMVYYLSESVKNMAVFPGTFCEKPA